MDFCTPRRPGVRRGKGGRGLGEEIGRGEGARGPAAPPASRPGLCGRSLRAPLGPPAVPRLSQGCGSVELAPVPRVAASHARSPYPRTVSLKRFQAKSGRDEFVAD
ncbi:Cytochrome P450 2U1 [Manis javanica]|nr:Cytochrome P450 2U1 [Manis javanica]